MAASGKIRAGMGGWTFEPWDTSFYPEKLSKAKQLSYASRQVPTIEAAAPLSSQQLVRALPCTLKTSPRRLGSFHHNTTHRNITFHIYSATSRARKGQWVSAPATADLPMSNAQRRILREHASLR